MLIASPDHTSTQRAGTGSFVAHRRPSVLVALAVASCGMLLGACAVTPSAALAQATLVDPDATAETRALYHNLMERAGKQVMFGHQDDLAYGVTWKGDPGRSDVKDVTGSYPAVYGWELGDLENGAAENLDGVNFKDMQRWIAEGYARGGVVTISWHMDNPLTKESAWDTTRAVHSILPGGENHELFKEWLDRFAAFDRGLRDSSGAPIPVLFRPYHEHTGSWFWWGKEHVTPTEYAALWRFTVDYLRDEKGLHNLLYVYSTDRVSSEVEYLEHYPGDAYVDVMGYDDYGTLRGDNGVQELGQWLSMITGIADAHGKLAAFTETGASGVRDSTWWTGKLLPAISATPQSRKVAYVLVWRNAGERQYFAPYPGQASAADFVAFKNDPLIVFGDELPDLYQPPRP